MGVLGLGSLKIANYKCFGEEPQGFEELKPINLLIGRNNSGKSSVLDCLRFATEGFPTLPGQLLHKGKEASLIFEMPLPETVLRELYQERTSGGNITGNHWEYGASLVGLPVVVRDKGNKQKELVKKPDTLKAPTGPQAPFEAELAKRIPSPVLGNKIFSHLLAERNVAPEIESDPISIAGNGSGVTNAIHQFLNHAKYPREVIDQQLLRELNVIVGANSAFSKIHARKIESNYWEIFLEEENKGSIALSQTGSGFKTVLLVLAFIHLLPRLKARLIRDYVFAFEELENNLHPAMHRRLLSYIRQQAVDHGATFVLTTHSNVAIDAFSRDKEAQIIHVSHDRSAAKVNRVSTYVEHKGILDDLDVRASDLLQSNGVVWVEGPSDRIYLNRWIELWTEGALREGTHYQIVFYGGRLLAHLDVSPPCEVSQTVQLLRVNRNAAVVIDSDRDSATATLNETKTRILEEIQKIDGFSWVTEGREIEHYIPAAVLQQRLGLASIPAMPMYKGFGDLLEELVDGQRRHFERNKPLFAETVIPMLSLAALKATMDLDARMTELCSLIRRWNGMH